MVNFLLQRLKFDLHITAATTGPACEVLANASDLAKSRIKDAMNKGAVRLRHGNKRWRLLRRATAQLRVGDQVQLHYDAGILAQQPGLAKCIADEQHYSIWYKPANMLAQGSVWGDHCSLLRLVEIHVQPRRSVYLVHRLDREAAGLMLIAHSTKAVAALSKLFHDNIINKTYKAVVRGRPVPEQGYIDLELDAKAARTDYQVLNYDSSTDTAELAVVIETGRKHQIRRHLEAIGHSVMGDPVYGQNNKNRQGLQLLASELRFICPLTGQARVYTV